MKEYLLELLEILNEMSPYLMLGFLISGLLHIYMPRSIYTRFLHRKGFGSVVGAALLGVPLPLCSCGVIPTSVSLKKNGASDGAMVSFLVSTPQTGVDSILATYSLLGLPMAIIRAVAAFVVAIFSGVLVDRFGASKEVPPQFRYLPPQNDKTCTCGCSHTSHAHASSTPSKSFISALKYGYVNMMLDFGKWLVVGLLIAAAITAFIPDSLFELFKEHYMLNILLILVLSTPMYVCATGSIPIALSLMLKGVSPGAAFVLLMAGPATNFAALIILRREIGVRKTVIYLLSIIIGAIACALVIDYLMPAEWFSHLYNAHDCAAEHHHHDHCTHGPVWWQTTTSVMFIILFANAYIQRWRKRC